MSDWTPEIVEERLVEAVAVLRRLPAERGQGYFSTWPQTFVEFSDLVGQTPEPMRLPPPSAAAISRMEAALCWMPWLEPVDAKIVWLRASGMRWKEICWTVGLARAAAHEHWRYSLCLIAWRLSKGPLRASIGRRRLLSETRRRPARATGGILKE
jgi:hypothetical protein